MAASPDPVQCWLTTTETFGALRAALIAHIPALLDRLGCDSTLVLQRAGIPRELLVHDEQAIGYGAVGRLIEESVRATGLVHFGLLVGEHFSPSVALGDVIGLMQNAPSVEVALRALVLHHHLSDTGAVPMLLHLSNRRVALAHVIVGHDVPAMDAFYDAAVAYGMQIMRLLCGDHWAPLRVQLAHRAPTDMAPYRRMFGPHVRFDAALSAIEFSADVLPRPVVGADPALYARLQDEMRRKLRLAKISFADRVGRALRPMILTGVASAANLANLFSISERVLRSRLALEGASFRQLLQQARLDLATQLLRSTELSVAEIGAAVGYADPPSFVRAFRSRAPGVTPGECRAMAVHGAMSGLASTFAVQDVRWGWGN